MMKIRMEVETMNRVLEVLRPLSGAADCVRFDFGTSKIEGAMGVPDVMRSKISVATGNEQVELAVTTLVPAEIERPLEECSLKNPLETVVVSLVDFVAVADALSQYEEAFEVSIDDAKMMLSVGSAYMPVHRVDATTMKALVPHRQNSGEFHLFDTDVMTIRLVGKEFLEAAKVATSFQKKTELESLKHYVVSVLDIPPVTQEVEKDGKKFNVVKYNASVQVAGTNRFAFASGSVNAFIHKGAGADLVGAIRDKSALEGVEHPIISFEKQEDSVVPKITSYEEFKKEYDVARDMETEEFRFAIPMDAMERIIRLVSVNPEAYVDVTVGKRYIFVTFMGLGAIYMCAQKALSGKVFLDACRGLVANTTCSVSVDSKGLQSSLKLANVYSKDALISQMPIELVFEEQGITMKRGESESLVKAIEVDTKMDLLTYGINGDYISCVMSGLPSGTIQVNYGGEKPLMVFGKGGEKISPLGTWIVVSAISDIQAQKRQVEDAYKKALAEKEKKEKEKGKKN